MSDETELRQKAREAIQAGKLPSHPPERMWGGQGSGRCCTICGSATERDEIEFELEFVRHDGGSDGANPLVHLCCLAAWESVCRNFEAARETVSLATSRLAAPPLRAGGASESN
jgi:hypothetical protein